MKHVLITGKNSYIGSNVEAWLNKYPDQYKVDVLDLHGDDWKQFDFHGYDSVYHVAGIAHRNNVPDELYEQVNHILAVDVAKRALESGVKQFIFMSSGAVYFQSDKRHGYLVADENTPFAPETAYGISKKKAEEGIRKIIKKIVIEKNSINNEIQKEVSIRTAQENDANASNDNNDGSGIVQEEKNIMKLAILRPPTVYGIGAKGNYNPLAKLARTSPIFPKIKNTRSMIYIDNLCEFIKLVIDNEAEGIFLPQNAEYVDTAEMVRLIAEVNGHKIWITPIFNWLVRLLGRFDDSVNKAVGTYYYRDRTYFDNKYRLVGFKESIIKIERKENKHNKKEGQYE